MRINLKKLGYLIHIKILIEDMGRGCSVGIATRYGLVGPGIESR